MCVCANVAFSVNIAMNNQQKGFFAFLYHSITSVSSTHSLARLNVACVYDVFTLACECLHVDACLCLTGRERSLFGYGSQPVLDGSCGSCSKLLKGCDSRLQLL